MQLAHRVPFKIGVVDWGLTPDWLDGADNLCLAHVGNCNDRAELSNLEVEKHLRASGFDLADSPAVASGEKVIAAGADGGAVEFRSEPRPSDRK